MTVYGPLFSSQANMGSRSIALLGNPAPPHPPRGTGRIESDFRCPRELEALPRYAQSRGTAGQVHGPLCCPRKPTGSRAPSINIGAGHSALEYSRSARSTFRLA